MLFRSRRGRVRGVAVDPDSIVAPGSHSEILITMPVRLSWLGYGGGGPEGLERRGMIHRMKKCGIDVERRRERRRPKGYRKGKLSLVFKYCCTYRISFSLEVFFYQCWHVYPIRTFPTVMCSTVALPPNEKLQFFCSSVVLRVKHSFDFILFFSFDKFRGRLMKVSSMFRRFSIWCK